MRFFVLISIAIVLFAFLARPLVLNQVPIEYDLGRYHLPLRDFYQKCLHNGDDPAWCPHLFCGYDLHGEGQAGMDHPWHKFLYTILPLTVAFNIEVFANYPLLCLGMYLFLRRHQLSREACLAGALTATFGGFTLPHYSHTNAIAIIAHLPWLLWATDVLWTEPNRRCKAIAGMTIALLTGSQILLGYPQYVYFSCLAEGVYVLCLLLGSRRFVEACGGTAIWLLFKATGVAIGGAQLLPSLQALQLSPRLGYDATFRGILSLPWEMLLQLIAPTQFNVGTQLHEYTVYGGCLATLGTAWFLYCALWFDEKSVLDRFAILLIIIAVPLALGHHTPLFQVYLKLPIVGVFRCPCRYLVLSHFAAAIVVGRMTQRLAECQRILWRRLHWLLLVPLLSCSCMFIPWQRIVSDDCQKFLAPNDCWIGAVSLSLATVLLIAASRGHRIALSILLVVGFADLGYWGFRTIYGTHDTPVHTFVNLQQYMDAQLLPPVAPNGRLQLDDIHGNAAMMLGWSLTSGYVGLTPPRALDYSTVDALQKANTTWRYRDRQWEAIDGLPRVRWRVNSPTQPTWCMDRPGHIEIATESDVEQVLILSESFHPNWRATIDGQPVDVATAEGDFQSCVVPAGKHTVVFHFDPAQRSRGRRLSLAGLVGCIGIAGWLVRPRRSNMTMLK